MGRLHGLLGTLFLVGAVAPHAVAQTDAEFQPLRDWVWTRAGATWEGRVDPTQERLLVTSLARSRVAYRDSADRLEVDKGLVAFRASGAGALELRALRIAHVPAATTGPRATPDDGTVYAVGDPSVKPPALAHRTQPRYPAGLMRDMLSGVVFLEGIVGVDGVPRDLRVVTSPHPDLSTQAIACEREWRFSPPMKDGEPVASKFTVQLAFGMYDATQKTKK